MNRRRLGDKQISDFQRLIAKRTAFIARFIVLREGKRSRAHRMIEQLSWDEESSAEEIANMIRQAFISNGDKMQPVEKDLRKALDHAERSVQYFVDQYFGRATLTFIDALKDYSKSNELLFGEDSDEVPRSGGWTCVSESAVAHPN